MKIAVLCLVALLAVVIKAAPVQEEQEGDELQEMNIEARADADAFEQLRQEMNIEARAEAEVFERLLHKLDAMAKREPNPNPRGCRGPECYGVGM